MSLYHEISATKVHEPTLEAMAKDGHPVELSVVMPCLNEQETVAVCVRKAIVALSEAGIVGRGDRCRQRIDRRLGGASAGRRRQGSKHRAEGIRQRTQGRDPCGTRRIRADGRLRRQLRLQPCSALRAATAHRIRSGHGQSLPGGISDRPCPSCIAISVTLCLLALDSCFSGRLAEIFIAACVDFRRRATSGWIFVRRAWSSPAKWS